LKCPAWPYCEFTGNIIKEIREYIKKIQSHYRPGVAQRVPES